MGKAVGSWEAVASGCYNKHFHQSIVVWGHTGDVCFNGVGGVRVTVVGCDERGHPVAERGHGRRIPVKGAI